MFDGSFGGAAGNFHRVLCGSDIHFNTNRWCFSSKSQVTYRFGLPGHQILSGAAGFIINFYNAGECVLEASRDQAKWVTLATKNSLDYVLAPLPAELLPADTLFLRLRATGDNASFQINRIRFDAKLSGDPPQANGRTCFAELEGDGPTPSLETITLQQDPASGETSLRMTVRNPGKDAAETSLKVTGVESQVEPPRGVVPTGHSQVFTVKLRNLKTGENTIGLALAMAGQTPLATKMVVNVPEYYRADFGQRIAGIGDATPVWWCPATWKISPQRPLPAQTAPAATMSAARHDHQAVQIVVRPTTPLKNLTATAAALAGPDGATIAPENIKILRAYYHMVEIPTDATGARDRWPDALPPLDKPIDVVAGENQPLWVLVYVPKDAKPGDYVGKVSLTADGFSATVPLKLHVWDFALPERNHLATAFGFYPSTVFQYHGLKTDADKRRVLDMYFQSFVEHRISPYDPTPLDPIRVTFVPDAKPPRVDLDFTAFDREMARVIEKYHFTNFRLHLDGMGGGTFHSRSEPDLKGFGENTPEYKAMFASYVGQLRDHLKTKGWLDMAYVYWFDEPDPKDYAFVSKGMLRLKQYAPGLPRMLTEEPNDDLQGIDIWCPLTPNYNAEAAARRRAHGERFWWYVCCVPQSPFCTLFIDHPATDLRVWHWQTWQRDIVGTLIWVSNYWTSDAAFPDTPQNPYEDPMSYVSGYSTPKDVKLFWGNGDGRFLYPPLAAATPGKSGDKPVLEPPVSSIRWEMLREGVEDYEFLYLLRERLAQRRASLSEEQIRRIESLLSVPKSITADMTTFTTDPAPIDERRAAIAEAIEELGR